MRLSASQIADKMASRAAAAQSDYTSGVMSVTTAPGARAAANKAGYLNGVTSSADKWARNTAAVSLSEWQTATAAKAGRFAQGVQAAKPKIEAFWNKFGPVLDSVTAATRAMPATNLEDRIARANAQMRNTAKYGK